MKDILTRLKNGKDGELSSYYNFKDFDNVKSVFNRTLNIIRKLQE